MYVSYVYWPHGRTAVTIIVTDENGLSAAFFFRYVSLNVYYEKKKNPNQTKK